MYLSKYGLRIEMHPKVTYFKYYKTLVMSCFWADRIGKIPYLFLLAKQKQN